ncbi:MAG: cyclic nucleotide-binding domain-containing protein, partial [Deltaproteobacteria bacterium]|nr:cyclic nucleotide-binding domain-containing protein [Deltaproteobacteria bacterium]
IMVPYEPGQEILVEGETGRSLFVLASGSVEVVRTLPSGERKVVDTMQAGSFFGEIGLVADVPRLATVVAAEDCVVLEVTREHVRELSKRFPVLPELVRTFYKERLLANLIRSSPIFAPLTASERRAVADKFVVLDVGAGEVLLKQGEAARGLFLLLRGRCAVSYRDQQGADHDLPEMAEGAVMGEISLVNDSPVTATVTARTQSVLLQLDPATFAARVFANPKTRELILELSNERQARTDAIDAAAPGPELL